LNIASTFQHAVDELSARVNEFKGALRAKPLSEEPGAPELKLKIADPVSTIRHQVNETWKTLITMRDNAIVPGLNSGIGNPENVELPSTVSKQSQPWSKLARDLKAADEVLQNVAATNESIIQAAPRRQLTKTDYYPYLTELNGNQLPEVNTALDKLIQSHAKVTPMVQQACQQIETRLEALREPDPIEGLDVGEPQLQPDVEVAASVNLPVSPIQRYQESLDEIINAATKQNSRTTVAELIGNDGYTKPSDTAKLREAMHETQLVIQQLEKLNIQHQEPAVSRAADLASRRTWNPRDFGKDDIIHGRPQEQFAEKIKETQTQLKKAYRLGMDLCRNNDSIDPFDGKRNQVQSSVTNAFESLQTLKKDAIAVMKNMF
jgi:hypothetical protein